MRELLNSFVYDSVNDVFVLFGGQCFSDAQCADNTFNGDTWVYKLSTNTWTTTVSPSVSTQEAAADEPAGLSPALAPQPERPRTRTSAEAGSTRASRRDEVIGGPFAVAAATGNQPT